MFKKVSLKAAIIPAALFVLIFCKTASSQTLGVQYNSGSFSLTAVVGSIFGSDRYDQYGYDCYGYNRDGYSRDGYNRDGYDRDGYDRDRHERTYYDNQRRDNDRDRYDRNTVLGDDSHMYYKSDNDKRDNDKYNKEYNNRGKQKRDKR